MQVRARWTNLWSRVLANLKETMNSYILKIFFYSLFIENHLLIIGIEIIDLDNGDIPSWSTKKEFLFWSTQPVVSVITKVKKEEQISANNEHSLVTDITPSKTFSLFLQSSNSGYHYRFASNYHEVICQIDVSTILIMS